MQEERPYPFLGPLVAVHRWLAVPPMELDEERYELYPVTTWAMALGLLSHVGFGTLFAVLGVDLLALFNVLSVAIFAVALVGARRAYLNESLMLASAEVVAHAWIATALLGWGTGFHFHIVLALVLFVLFTILQTGRRIAGAVALGLSYLALAVYGSVVPATQPIDVPWMDTALTAANTGIFVLVLSGICVYYTWTVQTTRRARDEAATELVDALEATRELERLKTDFTATVSHELRTPLTSVLGFAKVIRARLDERILPAVQSPDRKLQRAIDQVRTNVDIVISEGERLTLLINDVLDIAKMEAGQLEYADEVVVPSELVERSVATSQGLFTSGSVELVKEVGPNLPTVRGDAFRLQQVLINLISNAAKFTDTGSVTVRAVTAGPRMVRFEVADTGEGIAAEAQRRIFDRFKQVGTLDDKPKGTGLGLAISRQIVLAHNGEIGVQSALGEGSTFWFEIRAGQSVEF